MKSYNSLKLEAYSSGTTCIDDPKGDLLKAKGVRYSTGYSGGLYLDGSFRIHRNILNYLAIKGSQRIDIRNGLTIVSEGYVNDLARTL